jgi:glycosyltransferase involved in cell wall biosynthesis
MKKRIVFFIGSMGNGGAQRVLSVISDELIRLGYTVTILSYHDCPAAYEINSSVKNMSVIHENGRSLIKNVLWIHRYFKKNADIVVSFMAPFNVMAVIARFGIKVPLLVADRNDPRFVPEKKILRLIRDALYRCADGVIVQTTHNKDYFSKKVQEKSIVIFNPVDLKREKGSAITTEKKKEIVSVGRVMPQKNQEMLLEAFSRVYAKHPEYSLVIYGDASNTVQKDVLLGIISEMKMEQAVSIPGSVRDVINRIASAEMFILSSLYEGMPNALIEAMCVGLPCISTKVSGATDLIDDGRNGFLIDVGDVDALTERMLCLIENPDLREACANEAVKINDKLEVHKIIKEWVDYISLF